ncbi:MAG: amidohydrolase [Anaerolineales bacterium]|nr:amidohydrolase [Anaerolineales bacterium]MDW8226418.1 amidohydrolase [Anaerolineales bacterium]
MHLLFNARIYTFDRRFPLASALAIEGERIIAVGGDELLSQYPQAERQDMHQAIVLPGLTDAHIHIQHYVLSLQKIDCELPTKEQILARVAQAAKRARPGEWIIGHGWNQNTWGGTWPTAVDLDAVAPLNPVYLTAKSLHAGWANSLALRYAKLEKFRHDPRAQHIQRNKRGKPTGILFEGAMALMEAAIPLPGAEQLAEMIRQALPTLWKIGLTGIHNFDRSLSFRALQILNKRGELRLRVLQSIPGEDLQDVLRLGLRGGWGDDHLRIGPLKLFSDGALGPRTAAMLEPYVDAPENRGILLMNAEEIFAYGREAARAGLNLAVHAIGDRANREVLNAFERLRAYEKEHGLPALRHRIEHVQLLHPDDAHRLAALELVASMQPIHATSDMEMAERGWGKRAALAYAWKTQLAAGARLAFGSDAPVENPNPFWGLHAAVTRRRADGAPAAEGWYPQERLTVQEALEAYTLGPAYAAGWEDRLGRLTEGYLADLIVLESDPFTCPPEELRSLQPIATMIGGEWVWRA